MTKHILDHDGADFIRFIIICHIINHRVSNIGKLNYTGNLESPIFSESELEKNALI
jgi:hypothetical protein